MAEPSEMNAALRTFFSSPRFAVAGASSDSRKFGHKSAVLGASYIENIIVRVQRSAARPLLIAQAVHAWYIQHSLPAHPLNPRAPSVTVLNKDYTTVAGPKDLDSATSYSLSVITPPAVTKTLLEEAKSSGVVNAVWLQPGTYDEGILEYARKTWPDAAIGGTDVPGSRGGEGWCVLVDGEAGMKIAGRTGEKL